MDFEARVAAIRADVAEVLVAELDRTHDEVNLFELGLTSLDSIEIAARLRDLHGLEVTASTLFRFPTIKELAGLPIAADRGRR
ncbi:acyl carrier protein [Streptomyces sp. NPDC087901]|uniref:acyl carrier protein n=1 Tax=unclassified Streptomyces TaxID=2593676 RepID=UPI00344A388A